MTEFPNFIATLDQMKAGGTERELATKLGCDEKTIYRIRRGKLPLSVDRLARHPRLLRALAEDAERLQSKPEHQEAAA